jgi:hypothetical protein
MRRRLISAVTFACAFVLLLSVGSAEAASKFAWVGNASPGPGYGVYLMNSDGTGETLLTTYVQPIFPYELSWSPGGTMLAVFLYDQDQFSSESVNPRFQIIRISDGSVVANHPVSSGPGSSTPKLFEWSPEITPAVAAISPLGQLVIVFLLGAVTALYFSRQRQPLAG